MLATASRLCLLTGVTFTEVIYIVILPQSGTVLRGILARTPAVA
jgi:hypothetical protein